ncbi:MAG: peptidoglycan-binding domain-containing protein, partial [Candidatus Gracilibacteria bacterium]
TPTGNFGPITKEALGKFQIARGIVRQQSDKGYGYFGPRTKAALMETLSSLRQNQAKPSETPIHPTLLRTIAGVADSVRTQSAVSDPKLATSITRTPRQAEIMKKVLAQYDSSVAVWTKLKIPTKGIQTKQEVSAWLNSLPGKTLENLAAYGEIRLKFIPPIKTMDLMKAMNMNKGRNIIEGIGWEKVGAKEWEFGLTADVGIMQVDEGIYYVDPKNKQAGSQKNQEMIRLYEKKYEGQGLDIMSAKHCIPSGIEAMDRRKTVDDMNIYAFKDSKVADFVLSILWHNSNPLLFTVDPNTSIRNLRCQPWLQGKKI